MAQELTSIELFAGGGGLLLGCSLAGFSHDLAVEWNGPSLIERPQYPAPKVSLNPEVTNFYDFTTDDLIVEDYNHGPQVKNIPIAV